MVAVFSLFCCLVLCIGCSFFFKYLNAAKSLFVFSFISQSMYYEDIMCWNWAILIIGSMGGWSSVWNRLADFAHELSCFGLNSFISKAKDNYMNNEITHRLNNQPLAILALLKPPRSKLWFTKSHRHHRQANKCL